MKNMHVLDVCINILLHFAHCDLCSVQQLTAVTGSILRL